LRRNERVDEPAGRSWVDAAIDEVLDDLGRRPAGVQVLDDPTTQVWRKLDDNAHGTCPTAYG
jgi:hypothetical protein